MRNFEQVFIFIKKIHELILYYSCKIIWRISWYAHFKIGPLHRCFSLLDNQDDHTKTHREDIDLDEPRQLHAFFHQLFFVVLFQIIDLDWKRLLVFFAVILTDLHSRLAFIFSYLFDYFLIFLVATLHLFIFYFLEYLRHLFQLIRVFERLSYKFLSFHFHNLTSFVSILFWTI